MNSEHLVVALPPVPLETGDVVPLDVPALGFTAFYEERYDAMVRVAFLMVGDAHVAEEIVQDAFARVYLKWPRVEHPITYVRQAVVNGARDVIRRRKLAAIAHRRRHDRPIVEAKEHVDDLLRALTPRERAVVVLRFYEDQSIDDIAHVLGTKPGTVKSLLHRALARLRERIEP
jgi:RNA polymerase sigma-70 factor (sigma-E family)